MSTIEKRLLKIQSEFTPDTTDIEEIKPAKKKVILIMGAGDGLGAAIAREFASHNFITIVCRRNKEKLQPLINEIQARGHICHGYGVDCRKEDQVLKLINDVEKFYGPIEVGVFNIGANVTYDIANTTYRVFFKLWEMACYSGFIFGKELSQKMIQRQRGTILFTGATASLRGSAGFSAFGSAKAGLRSLAQSMAKELGPQNIHVAHIIIDGGIDSQFIRNVLKDKLNQSNEPIKDQLLQPQDIAKNYWHIYKQPKNAWTFELDLRPYTEKW